MVGALLEVGVLDLKIGPSLEKSENQYIVSEILVLQFYDKICRRKYIIRDLDNFTPVKTLVVNNNNKMKGRYISQSSSSSRSTECEIERGERERARFANRSMSGGIARGRLAEERKAWRKNHPHVCSPLLLPPLAPDLNPNLHSLPRSSRVSWQNLRRCLMAPLIS